MEGLELYNQIIRDTKSGLECESLASNSFVRKYQLFNRIFTGLDVDGVDILTTTPLTKLSLEVGLSKATVSRRFQNTYGGSYRDIFAESKHINFFIDIEYEDMLLELHRTLIKQDNPTRMSLREISTASKKMIKRLSGNDFERYITMLDKANEKY